MCAHIAYICQDWTFSCYSYIKEPIYVHEGTKVMQGYVLANHGAEEQSAL